MPEVIPLFPLGTVLFPGVVLPLHIFEERYRALVHDLRQRPPLEREFGVVTIREGWEVGEDGAAAVHGVGTTAALRTVRPLPDGRSDVVCVGARRFRLRDLEPSGRPYLMASVEWFPDPEGDHEAVAFLAERVGVAFRSLVAELGGGQDAADDSGASLSLPTDPRTLSNLVAASAPFDLTDRLVLLDQPTVQRRLAAELGFIRRERAILAALHAVPVPLARLGLAPSPN